MKSESKPLSTADLAQAGARPEPEKIDERPSALQPGVRRGVLESTPAHDRNALEAETVKAEERKETVSNAAVPVTKSAEPAPSPAASADAATAPLFEGKEAEDFRARWNEIQVGFVDEPRTAVEHADSLVAETIKRLAESFASGRQKLEADWSRGGDASTETLRLTLQRYRSFFNRLLAI